MSDSAHALLDGTPLRALLGIPREYLDEAMSLAYQLYCARRHQDAEVMCRGLLAADHRNWWTYSLYAATLLKLGRNDDARALLERGLRYAPNHPKLLAMRAELTATSQPEAAS